MALSATHFLGDDLTFGILYGCTYAIEKNVLKRLQSITYEAAHPMVLPGIFMEIELSRHTRLVETSVNEVETKIFELNFQSGDVQHYSRAELEKRNIAKRTAWLDLSYLRNSITTWSTQLIPLAERTEELNRQLYTSSKYTKTFVFDEMRSKPEYVVPETKDIQRRPNGTELCEILNTVLSDDDNVTLNCQGPPPMAEQMQKLGKKIKSRIFAIREEYDEKIRDCTMRVDGMAMATQWVRTMSNIPRTISSLLTKNSRIAKPLLKLRSPRTKIPGSCDQSLWLQWCFFLEHSSQ